MSGLTTRFTVTPRVRHASCMRKSRAGRRGAGERER